MTEPNWTTFAISFIMLIIGLGFRLALKSWFAPGAIFALYWGVFGVVAQIALPYDLISPDAMVWITLAVVAVGVGNLFTSVLISKPARLKAPKPPSISSTDIDYLVRLSFIGIIISTIIGIVYNVWSTQLLGYSFNDAFESVTSLAFVANGLTVLRYAQGYDLPTLIQLLLSFVFLGPMFGGTLAALTKLRRDWLISSLSIVPAVVLSLLRTQRSTLLTALVLWISAYLAIRVWQGRHRLFTLQFIVLSIMGLVIIGLIGSGASLLRINSTSVSSLTMLAPKLMSGTFGYLAVFSQWFSGWSSVSGDSYGMGVYTFAGIADFLRIYSRPIGLYTDFVRLASGDLVNIYTIFRPLIMDFTVVGVLVFLVWVGIIAGYAYKLARESYLRAVPILTVFYAITLWSIITSLFTYNSILVGMVIYFLAFIIRPKLRTYQRAPSAIPGQNRTSVSGESTS